MLSDPNSGRLYRSSLALVNFKGGAGKTVLAGNIASIASRVYGWQVCVIDLDASAPLTKLALNDIPSHASVKQALTLAANGGDAAALLQFSNPLGFFLLPGSVKGVSSEEVRYLPALIQSLKAGKAAGTEIDLVIVDTPGENKIINGAVMASVDHIAMPLALNATDMTATAVTISFVHQMQQKRDGLPVFLGMIPNRVQRRGTYEKAFLDQVLQAGVILPYIPESNIIKGSFSRSGRDGGEVPIYFAPKAAATQRLVHLLSEMNDPDSDTQAYVDDVRGYLGLIPEGEGSVD